MNNLEKLAEDGGPLNVDQRKSLNAEFWHEIRMKESLLRQKSRVKWVAEGDSNTRFFHACMRSNRRRTQLFKIKVGESWVEDVQGVREAVKNHFEEGYKEAEVCRPKLDGVEFKQVSIEDNDVLVAPFSMEEIKVVVWDCNGNKSPGPDGFNLTFFKHCWEVVSNDIFKFFEEFHSMGRLPKAISASFIALIPKKSNPQTLGEYWPISLIGSLYKILAKVLAGRLKKVLKGVISESQNAFLPGRKILDGVLITNEILDMAKRKKQKCVALTMSKQSYPNGVVDNYQLVGD